MDSKYTMFYASTTPTHYGQTFMRVFQSHVVLAYCGSPEEKYAEQCGFTKLDKTSNSVLCFSKDSGVALSQQRSLLTDKRFQTRCLSAFSVTSLSRSRTLMLKMAPRSCVYQQGKFSCPWDGCAVKCHSFVTLKDHYPKNSCTDIRWRVMRQVNISKWDTLVPFAKSRIRRNAL